MLEDLPQQTLIHVSKILGLVQSKQFKQTDPSKISGIAKRNILAPPKQSHTKTQHHSTSKQINFELSGQIPSIIKNFKFEVQKFQWTGISFDTQSIEIIQNILRQIAIKQKTSQIRFWGLIRGTIKDYYIVQGRRQPHRSNSNPPFGAEKQGEGVNYYTYWVTNDINSNNWVQLPDIEPFHIKVARSIKRLLTGDLNSDIQSFPQFNGKQKQYLKAQVCRITHALQLTPKGIYKANEENPKIIQLEEEVKIPQFTQLNSLQGWVHKNQMILNLGRCSHFVDPSLPEEQIATKTAELAQKDPQIQRLKGINQDKLPEQFGLGLENPWVIKVCGNNQIFTKDDANFIYGVVVLKNIYWPGWVTVGYKNGFSNIYVGNGLKFTQPSLSIYQNPDLEKDPEGADQYPQPNPKQLPKQEPPGEGEPKPEQ